MDAKALAKSKRAHTQHHNKKYHSSDKSKAQNYGSNDAKAPKKPPGKQLGEKMRQAQRISGLPSNWERYGEEFDPDSTSQPSDVIIPKSKGADYSYLIDEAQSQSESKLTTNSETFLSLDDVLPDEFSQGVAAMLSVRGEGILSWIGDDNFIVDDRTTVNQEASSFLSLNLDDLAKQLEKVDLHERLYIEEDLIPSELIAELSKRSSSNKQETNGSQRIHESTKTIRTDGLLVEELSEKVNVADKSNERVSLAPGRDPMQSATKPKLNLAGEEVTNQSSSRQFGESSQNMIMDSTLEPKPNPIGLKNKIPSFEASAAEAELDMLLNSFSDTKVDDSARLKFGNGSSVNKKEAFTSRPQQHSSRGQDLSVTTDLDDVLDNLLEQTSNLVVKQTRLSHREELKSATPDAQPSSSSVHKSQVLDDFDSWLESI